MVKLKFFLTEKDFLDNYMEIKELQKQWFANLLYKKFIPVNDFIKMRVNHKHIKNIYSEDFYVSADYNTPVRELERAILKFEKSEKKLEFLSKLDILNTLELN